MNKNIFYPVFLWYTVYAILINIIQPFSWFGGQKTMENFGLWGNILIFILPLIGVAIFYLIYKRREKVYLGVTKLSNGLGRDDAFQNIRMRAKKKIFIVGIGMSNIAKYGKDSLLKQAANVNIDFLMIDPEYLENNDSFAETLGAFLDIKNFSSATRTSFEELKEICVNNNRTHSQRRLRLRVYRTLPTASMVMIDPDTAHGECVIEFFLFRSGERRPRFECKQIENNEGLFDILKDRYLSLWNASKSIIE